MKFGIPVNEIQPSENKNQNQRMEQTEWINRKMDMKSRKQPVGLDKHESGFSTYSCKWSKKGQRTFHQ